LFGEVEDNTAINNGADGILLAFEFGEADVAGNTADGNADNGIDLSVTGDYFSDIDISDNTSNNNGAEAVSLTFGGTGTSVVELFNNTFSGNNGGVDREFIAQVDDVFEYSPTVYIELEGNISTNALGAGPPFNYEFENSDLFSDGRMIVDVNANTGTVELGEGVEAGNLP
jgi:hypothetical protein